MKQTLLVIVVSAAIGAAAALHFAPPAPAARSAPQLDVRAIQLAVEGALRSVGFGSEARVPLAPPSQSAASGSGAPAPEAGDIPGPAVQGARDDAAPALPPADRRALESLRPFDKDEMLRRTWLFRSERDVIAWLGTPDEVSLEDGGERWLYNTPDGTDVVVAYFARGRLLSIYR